MSVRLFAVVSLGLSMVALAWAQPAGPGMAGPAPAATQSAVDPLGAVRVGDYAAMRFVYLESQASFQDLGASIGPMIEKVDAARADGKLPGAGPVVFAYVGVTDMSAPFTLQIGCQVPADAKAPEGFEVRDMPADQYASVLFTGPYTDLPMAWGRFIGQVMQMGLEPAGESREVYLYGEDPESENNVTMLQVKVK